METNFLDVQNEWVAVILSVKVSVKKIKDAVRKTSDVDGTCKRCLKCDNSEGIEMLMESFIYSNQ